MRIVLKTVRQQLNQALHGLDPDRISHITVSPEEFASLCWDTRATDYDPLNQDDFQRRNSHHGTFQGHPVRVSEFEATSTK